MQNPELWRCNVIIPNGHQWAAAFLAGEPNYDEADWLAAYATVLSRCKPELSTEDVTHEAYAAFEREGDWNHPKEHDDEITISYNSNHLFVSHGDVKMICRLIDARFPDYKVVIPTDNPYKLIVAKSDFQSSLRLLSVFSNKSTNQVALSISGSELQLAAQDVDFSFEGNERMSCQYDGEDLQIAFNAKFLIEMLNAAETPEINVELSTPTKAGIIKPTEAEENEELLMLVMPLMLNN
jgi:DNA polymerase III sliding clamp (beta) subunit (PCNA family)